MSHIASLCKYQRYSTVITYIDIVKYIFFIYFIAGQFAFENIRGLPLAA